MTDIDVDELRDFADAQRGTLVLALLGQLGIPTTVEVRTSRTTMLLGGGGAKGCFEAGALACLAHTGEAIYQPHLVCGTSVGAVNGVLVTENTNVFDNSRLRLLVEIWMGLSETADFFVDAPDLERLDDDLPSWLKDTTGLDLTSLGRLFIMADNYGIHESEIPLSDSFVGSASILGDIAAALGLIFTKGVLELPGASNLATVAGVASYLTAQGLAENVHAALEIRALYSMAPVRQHIRDNVDESLLQLSGSTSLGDLVAAGDQTLFRMVSVEAGSGNIVWTDNAGRLQILNRSILVRNLFGFDAIISTHKRLFGKAITSSGQRIPLDLMGVIEEGVIGSAAIPLAFPPGEIYLVDTHEHRPEDVATLVDGGVKDVLPTQACEDYLTEVNNQDMHNFVISISTDPQFDPAQFFAMDRSVLEALEPPDTYRTTNERYWNLNNLDLERNFGPGREGTNLLDLTLRAIDLQGEEIVRTDRLDLAALAFDVEEMVIAPSFPVNGVGQIDRGLIRIAIAYGWMRAADMVLLRNQARKFAAGSIPSAFAAFGPVLEVIQTSDLITRIRMNCWRHEMRYTPAGSVTGFSETRFENGVIDLLRNAKDTLAMEIGRRRRQFASTGLAVEPFPTEEWVAGETPNDWLDFELHSRESFWFHDRFDEDLGSAAYTFLQDNNLWTSRLAQRNRVLTPATRPVIP